MRQLPAVGNEGISVPHLSNGLDYPNGQAVVFALEKFNGFFHAQFWLISARLLDVTAGTGSSITSKLLIPSGKRTVLGANANQSGTCAKKETRTGANTNWRGSSGCTLADIRNQGIQPTRILVLPAVSGTAIAAGTVTITDAQFSIVLLAIPIVLPAASELFGITLILLEQTATLWRDFVVTGLSTATKTLCRFSIGRNDPGFPAFTWPMTFTRLTSFLLNPVLPNLRSSSSKEL